VYGEHLIHKKYTFEGAAVVAPFYFELMKLQT